MQRYSARLLPITAVLVLALGACGPAATASPAPPTTAAGTVVVTLQEWAVVAGSASAPAGTVTFDVTNQGPADVHEFVVIKTDLDAGSLPTDATGTVSEDGEGIEVKGEIEDLAVGANEQLELELEAGKYVLLCNIYSAEEQEAHYKMGMRTAFTVGG